MSLCTFALLLSGWAKVAQGQTALSVSGSPAPFTITTAGAGSQPAALTNSVTTYSVRAKAAAQKITAHLDAPMPLGTTLTVEMVAPAGATSMGAVSLDATDRNIVINIANVNTTQGITYVFSATVAAGVIPTLTRTVTFTESIYP